MRRPRRLNRIAAAAAAGVAAATAATLASLAPAAAERNGGEFRFETTTIALHEGGGRAVLTVRRDATLALEDSRAWFSTIERSASGEDFAESNGWLRMAIGETSASVVIPIFDDVEDESVDESFAVRLTMTPNGATVVDEAVVTILDDDDPPEPVATIPPGDSVRPVEVAAAASTPAPRAATTPVVRTVPQAQRRSARAPQAARVTPFELQTPDGGGPGSLPVPEHASPVVAASFLAALALARVTAELWFRWRTFV